MWRSLLAATAVVLLGLLGPSAAGRVQDAVGGSSATGAQVLADAAAVGGLAVAVDRDRRLLVAQRGTTYTIAVGNRGERPREVVVRAAVPPWLTTAAPQGARVGAGFIDWPMTVAPGSIETIRITGAYAAPGSQVPSRVSLTVCAVEPAGNQPITCDTDLAELHPLWWYAAWWTGAGLAVLAAALLLRRRRGKVRRADSPRPRSQYAASGH